MLTRLRDYLSAVRLMWAQIADLRAALRNRDAVNRDLCRQVIALKQTVAERDVQLERARTVAAHNIEAAVYVDDMRGQK